MKYERALLPRRNGKINLRQARRATINIVDPIAIFKRGIASSAHNACNTPVDHSPIVSCIAYGCPTAPKHILLSFVLNFVF